MIPEPLQSKLEKAGIIAVLVIDHAEQAVKLARTLVDEGITAMELTLRTPESLKALGDICSAVPEMTAGAGTILTPEQLQAVKKNGAAFGVAPGFNRTVMDAARDHSFPFAPGIAIPSEIEWSLEYGCRVLKFFHAEGMGGVGYLKGISTPYACLGIRFIPLGGLTPELMRSYLEMKEILAIGGSWIAPRSLIAAGNWNTIARNAREAVRLLREVRG